MKKITPFKLFLICISLSIFLSIIIIKASRNYIKEMKYHRTLAYQKEISGDKNFILEVDYINGLKDTINVSAANNSSFEIYTYKGSYELKIIGVYDYSKPGVINFEVLK